MSRRLRRLPILLLPLALATTLVACGSDSGSDSSSSDSSSDALHGIEITGDVGKAPTVKWDGELEVDKTDSTVVVEGDGAKVADGDQVVANIWIGNGTTQKQSYSTYDDGQTQSIPVSADLNPVFQDALLDQTVGSRTAVTTTAALAFGDSGNPQMDIGNKDTVLIIVDIMDVTTVLDGPDGTDEPAPSWAPDLVTDGDAVKKGQTITVNYLGQVYDAAQPFDESYSKTPASFAIGVGQVVPGWDKTLVGAKVGSRMILAIPPAEGYGDAGNEQAGIKGTDTLYFVVDILAAS